MVSTSKPFTLCVFCGSSPGRSPIYSTIATALAETMHAQSWSLVYGGGTRGLMGTLASTLVSLSGRDAVTGIIPCALLPTERAGEAPTAPDETAYGRTILVQTMHARKADMASRADAFVALPGGLGTLEEVLEMATWSQLGIHGKPVILVNVDSFFDGLVMLLKKTVEEGFLREDQLGVVTVVKNMDELVEVLKSWKPAEGRYVLDWGERSAVV